MRPMVELRLRNKAIKVKSGGQTQYPLTGIMDEKVLVMILLYGIGVIESFHDVVYEYYFVDVKMNWTDAQLYCRAKYTDLATLRNTEDIMKVSKPSGFTGYAFIGLFDDPASWKGVMTTDSNSWRWSATGTASTSRYQNWQTNEPTYDFADNECVQINNGKWDHFLCTSQLYFVCFTGQSQPGLKHFILVQTLMTWGDALAYCRTKYTDLAMVEDEAENTAVAFLVLSNNAWIGLYRKPWRWSDNSNSNFKNWLVGQPDGPTEHCVAEASDRLWHDFSCETLLPFICHRALIKRMTRVKIQLVTGADLSDPWISAQVLEHLAGMLKSDRVTDIQLKWNIHP